ncbi:MAG: competence type IV pilus major pilin ComGC [Phycisphaerales bacterium]
MRKRMNRGFTLIEILIVVVILGILAAIVIPQFTSASEDAQQSQVQSQLQTVRGQIELFNVQTGAYPASVVAGTDWSDMTGGGYLQQDPRNSIRGGTSAIGAGTAVPTEEGGDVDWYWNTDRNILYAVDTEGDIIDF